MSTPNSAPAGKTRDLVVTRVMNAPVELVWKAWTDPALVMRCVEVVRGPETSDATVDAVVALTRELGKEPVVLRKEIPGRSFVAADDTAVCGYMKQITLEKVRDTLRDLAPAVEIDAATAAKARVAIDRMLAVHA